MRKLSVLLLGLILFACTEKSKKTVFSEQLFELNRQALRLTKEQQYDSAVIYLNKAIELDKKFYPAYVNKIYIFNLQNDYETSLKIADEQVRIAPRRPEAWLMDGVLNDVTGNSKKAMKCYEKSISLFETELMDPTNKQKVKYYKFYNAIALIFLGKETEARDEMKRVRDQYPADQILSNDIIDNYLTYSKEDVIKIFTNNLNINVL